MIEGWPLTVLGVSWREYVQEQQAKLSAVARFHANAPDAGSENSIEQERKQIKHAFFSAKRAHFPTSAQLRLFKELE